MAYVKHLVFSPAMLDGKKVAVCGFGHIEAAHFRVGIVRGDGFHELAITSMGITSETNSEGRIQGVPVEEPMNQDSVNKIVVPEAGSRLERLGYSFALIRDAESKALAVADQ